MTVGQQSHVMIIFEKMQHFLQLRHLSGLKKQDATPYVEIATWI